MLLILPISCFLRFWYSVRLERGQKEENCQGRLLRRWVQEYVFLLVCLKNSCKAPKKKKKKQLSQFKSNEARKNKRGLGNKAGRV